MMFKVYDIISRACLLISGTFIRMASFWLKCMKKEVEKDASRKTT